MSQTPREIKGKLPENVAKVLITPGADYALDTLIKDEGSSLDVKGRDKIILNSVSMFLTCDYMKLSTWFKSQPAHTFVGMLVKDPETKAVRADIRLVLRQEEGSRYVICSPAEQELPDGYFETRVIEETRVLYRHLLK